MSQYFSDCRTQGACHSLKSLTSSSESPASEKIIRDSDILHFLVEQHKQHDILAQRLESKFADLSSQVLRVMEEMREIQCNSIADIKAISRPSPPGYHRGPDDPATKNIAIPLSTVSTRPGPKDRSRKDGQLLEPQQGTPALTNASGDQVLLEGRMAIESKPQQLSVLAEKKQGQELTIDSAAVPDMSEANDSQSEPMSGQVNKGSKDSSKASPALGLSMSFFSSGKPDEAGKAKGGLFGDVEGMKDQLFEDIDKKHYDVADFYHNSPHFLADIARNEIFVNFTLVIISLNAIWIGVEIDHNDEALLVDADIGFQLGEHFFCCFFTLEVLIRFCAFKEKKNCLRDLWFKFDSALVCLMVFETWILPSVGAGGSDLSILSLLRLLRLLRLMRMTRLMRALPEVVTIIKGMLAATRSVSTMLFLLMICIYLYAIVFKMQVGDVPSLEEHFGTIPLAMWSLFMQGALLDDPTQLLIIVREENLVMTFFFLSFVVIANFMTMNMLIGILVEVITKVAETEKEQMVIDYVRKQLLDILDRIDIDGNKRISQKEFQNLLTQPDFNKALQTLGVDNKHIASLSDTLFEDENSGEHIHGDQTQGSRGSIRVDLKTLTFAEFLEMLLGLRATKQVSITNIFDLRKFIRFQNRVTTGYIEEMSDALNQVLDRQSAFEVMQNQFGQDMQDIKRQSARAGNEL